MLQIAVILTLLIITAPSINSANSVLQQEYLMQNVASIQIQDNQTATILFQYGAETGILQPPWDHIGPVGSGDKSGTEVTISATHVRTGSYAWKMYATSPPKSDAQRRLSNRKNMAQKEFYLSWWAYLPSYANWQDADTNGWGTTLGGWQIFFGPAGGLEPGGKWRWWTASRIGIAQSSRRITFNYGWGKAAGAEDFSPDVYENSWDTGYYANDPAVLDRWNHFQLYVRMANNSQGAIAGWFNDNLVMNVTGLNTDPSGYPEFASNNCVWAINQYPTIVIELYTSENTVENWYWVDDIVVSTEKVSETYAVK